MLGDRAVLGLEIARLLLQHGANQNATWGDEQCLDCIAKSFQQQGPPEQSLKIGLSEGNTQETAIRATSVYLLTTRLSARCDRKVLVKHADMQHAKNIGPYMI